MSIKKREYKIVFMLLFSALVGVLVPTELLSQVITTVGGGGLSTGDEIAATIARIYDPRGAAFDKYGNFYFADGTSSNRVRMIDTNGVITTVAGNGTGGFSGDNGVATGAELNYPVAVQFDRYGNLYVVDGQNYRVRKVDMASRRISTVVGTGISGYDGDGGPATNAELSAPCDLCFDKIGNMYIADGYEIRKVDTNGYMSTFAGIGTLGSTGDGGPATSAQLGGPNGVAADELGNVFIAERISNHVRKVNSAGIIDNYAGTGTPNYTGDVVAATASQIVPLKIGFDPENNLYITDDYNQRIYKIDEAGLLHLVAGDGTGGFAGDGGQATAAELRLPAGVAFDPCGNLIFPDTYNFRIRKIALNPECLNLAVSELDINKSASLLPNPASTLLVITSSIPISQISIANITGQIVYQEQCNIQQKEINIAALPPGLYFVAISDEEGNKTIKKFVKQ